MNKTVLAPDLGSDEGFPVVEILAKVGDKLAKDDPILLLESDKASMEIGATEAGTLTEICLSVNDTVKSHQCVAKMTVDGGTDSDANKDVNEKTATQTNSSAADEPSKSPSKPQSKPQTSPQSKTNTTDADIQCDLVVLGSGPGGYSAAFRAADLGLSTVLIEKYPNLGGVCLNVGCIPSKALLHTAHISEEAMALSQHGIHFEAPTIKLDAIRADKDKVVNKLNQGIAGMAKMRKVQVVQGVGTFVDENLLEVIHEGSAKTVAFDKAIIACGSAPIQLPFMPDDPRIIDSTGALELPFIPKHMLVIGGGVIGLEMATVYSALGAKISVVELSDSLMPGADADLTKVWLKANESRFEDVLLNTKVTAATVKKAGIEITFSGETSGKKTYDLVLVAVGRSPNGRKIEADNAGITVDERGFIPVDSQMRTNVPHIFAIGDVVGQPMLAHKAVHEGHVAAEVAAGHKTHFDARVIPSVAYTFPEIAFAGVTETEANAKNLAYKTSVFPWQASGKAIACHTDTGFTKLLFDPETDRIIGGSVVGLNAGDLIAEICLAIEMGADANDIGKTIHPHPTLSESVGMAAEHFHGHCTDLPPKK